jgi:hypothetical protein
VSENIANENSNKRTLSSSEIRGFAILKEEFKKIADELKNENELYITNVDEGRSLLQSYI